MAKIGSTRAQARETNINIILEIISDIAPENLPQVHEGWISRQIAEILLDTGKQNLLLAEKWIQRAHESDQKNGLKWYQARDHVTCAEIFKQKGENRKAIECLKKAFRIFKDCGADGWVERCENELAEL